MNRPTVGDVHAWLDSIAPFETAEGFDNVGLLIGDKAAPVSKVIFTLDLSEKTVDEAIAFGAELIITHHPIIFSPLRRIHYDTPFGRMLVKLTGAGISVIAAHTNWDKAPGGVGDTLAKLLALQNITPLDDYVRLGELATPILASEFAALLTKALNFAPRWYGEDKLLRKVAVAGGSYGEGYELALEAGADAFVTGEIKHHEILDAIAQGLIIYDGGHHATEHPAMPTMQVLFADICKQNGWQVETRLSMAPPFAGATHM
ncbi:MAG: Nif3-like dinuclear metal center hexameric protein [Clostridia bacterium]|nr:Nif3-like dinuclear metal center hexameric protein [Clostridia bacterium]MBP3650619.1 Nif3-like dinuclear metal center hexameric protein [Clostridia bacterium]